MYVHVIHLVTCNTHSRLRENDIFAGSIFSKAGIFLRRESIERVTDVTVYNFRFQLAL